MALRLYRLNDDEWRRLAASRRSEDLQALPARASISAIEVELKALERMPRRADQAAPGAA